MKTVHINKNPLVENEWITIETDDVLKTLADSFDEFPEHAKIYHNIVSDKNEVTPKTEKDIDYLSKLDGVFYVVVYPSAIAAIAMWVVVAITTALSVFTYLNMPKPKNSAPTSSNNELSSRVNNARINGRIPDIYGQLRATPDLISTPYTTYNSDGREVENCLMVIGRGYHQIHDCRESETDVEGISGTSVSIYDPFTSITGTPIYKSGQDFTDLPLSVKKSSAVNGQTLETPNDSAMESSSLYFEYPDLIKSRDTIDFSTYFGAGELMEIVGAVYGSPDVSMSGSGTFTPTKTVSITSSQNIANFQDYKGIRLTGALVEVEVDEGSGVVTTYKDLSGQYSVASSSVVAAGSDFKYTFQLSNAEQVNPSWSFVIVDEVADAGFLLNNNASTINLDESYSIQSIGGSFIKLSNPSSINDDWDKLQSLPNQSTISQTADITLNKITNKWVGWNSIAMEDAKDLILNIYFVNGLFRQDSKGGTSYAFLTIRVEYQQIDEDNNPFGQVYEYSKYFENRKRDAYGETISIPLAFTGSIRFRVCKTDVRQAPNVQADVKIKDAFLSAPSLVSNYGDVTVVRTRTIGTDGALSIKERKLNCLVTRKLRSDGTGSFVATKSSAQALINMAIDPYIGRRSIFEVDFEQIVAEELEINNYFLSNKPSEFSYTFDDENLSFEEQAGMIASAVFCEAYRFGNKLKMKFEKPQENSVLLFNHRNKQPMTEKRTQTFGNQNDYDGVELEYTSPVDDARIKYFVSSGGVNSTNPLKIDTSGIRNHMQAKIRAHREWNKIDFHRVTCEFTAMQESDILTMNDRILVSNDTKMSVQDGEILAQEALTLITSQPVKFETGEHYIHLQMPSGTVDAILCNQGLNEYEVVLTRAPIENLVLSPAMKVRTLYQLVNGSFGKNDIFLVSEVAKSDENSNTIKAINYSEDYYKDDHNFL